jgi:hypothetical protein
MDEHGGGQPEVTAFGGLVEAEVSRQHGRDDRATWREVAEPLGGRLLLSPRSAGSVVFFQPAANPRHGVVPNGVKLPGHCLYVASATGPDPHSNPPRYYLLPQSADLAELEARITAAMSGGTIVSVDFTGPADPGVVVINGGAVPFAVLCPASPRN